MGNLEEKIRQQSEENLLKQQEMTKQLEENFHHNHAEIFKKLDVNQERIERKIDLLEKIFQEKVNDLEDRTSNPPIEMDEKINSHVSSTEKILETKDNHISEILE